jgi:hypothetical protein
LLVLLFTNRLLTTLVDRGFDEGRDLPLLHPIAEVREERVVNAMSISNALILGSLLRRG